MGYIRRTSPETESDNWVKFWGKFWQLYEVINTDTWGKNILGTENISRKAEAYVDYLGISQKTNMLKVAENNRKMGSGIL